MITAIRSVVKSRKVLVSCGPSSKGGGQSGKGEAEKWPELER